MDKTASFWNRLARRYEKQPVADEASYQKKLQITRTYFQPQMKVLEFGSGTGSTAIIHAPHVKNYHAVDFSEKMLEIARAKTAAEKVENLTFEQSSIDDLVVADESLDMVLGLSILHLVKNKDQVITKVHKMLKPGGIFVSSTACLAEQGKMLRIIAPIGKFFRFMPPLGFFSREELTNRITETGFAIEHNWRSAEGKAVFIVAKKLAQSA